MDHASSHVTVCVRCKPFTPSEQRQQRQQPDAAAVCCVEMPPGTRKTIMKTPGTFGMASGPLTRTFHYDCCLWSHDRRDRHFADQQQVYDQVGAGVVEAGWDGFNSTLFAYGQTGSGKSYTMMDSDDEPGIIPRLCQSLFARMEAAKAKAEDGGGGGDGAASSSSSPSSPSSPSADSGWVRGVDPKTNHEYFFNTVTKESSWTLPPTASQAASSSTTATSDASSTEVVYSVELMSYVTTAGTQLLRKDGKWTLIPPKRDAQAAITKQVLTALREREGLASAAKEALQEAQQPPQECAESQDETTCVGRKRSAFVAGLVPSLFTVRAYFGSKFMAADVFKGRLDGFVFKSGQHGLGYYADSHLIAAPEAHPIDAAIVPPAHRTTTGQGVRVRVPRDATLTHVVRKSCLANLLPFVEPSARHKQQTFIRSSVIQDALCSGTNDSVKDDASVAATPPICLLLDELGGYDGSILTRSEPLVNRMFMYNLASQLLRHCAT